MSGSKRRRADQAVVAAGLAPSRAQAERYIRAGEIWLDDRRVDKPGQALTQAQIAQLTLRRRGGGVVGRGADKLAPVLVQGPDPRGKTCLDVGASTGGFTEVLLGAGAAAVWAVDVGYGQLHPRLRNDRRVTVLERTNFRYWPPEDVAPPPFALAVMDVSFISVRLLLAPLAAALAPGGDAVVLVKPQFELGKERVPRGGVVRDPAEIEAAVTQVVDAALARGFALRARFAAGVAGKRGNREVFLWLTHANA